MSFRRHCQSALCAIVLAATLPHSASAQESFAQAKEFYEQAAYEEALAVLGKLSGEPGASTEVAAYQVFCLVALGKNAEATRAIADIVRADPLYRPSEVAASPRIRSFFEDARRPLIPEIVRQSYAKAKVAFDQKDMTTASAEFDRAIGLLDELSGKEAESLNDLRTLAISFRDLARLSQPAAPPPASATAEPPAAAPTTASNKAPAGPPSATPAPSVVEIMGPVTATSSTTSAVGIEGPRIYGAADTGVQKPVAVTRPLPAWQPRTPVEARQAFHGILEVVVDEQGRVTHASLLRPVHPTYDDVLLKAIRDWKFRPAVKDGVPVKYRYTADIKLGPANR
jgi:TonB family protein